MYLKRKYNFKDIFDVRLSLFIRKLKYSFCANIEFFLKKKNQ